MRLLRRSQRVVLANNRKHTTAPSTRFGNSPPNWDACDWLGSMTSKRQRYGYVRRASRCDTSTRGTNSLPCGQPHTFNRTTLRLWPSLTDMAGQDMVQLQGRTVSAKIVREEPLAKAPAIAEAFLSETYIVECTDCSKNLKASIVPFGDTAESDTLLSCGCSCQKGRSRPGC